MTIRGGVDVPRIISWPIIEHLDNRRATVRLSRRPRRDDRTARPVQQRLVFDKAARAKLVIEGISFRLRC